MQFRLLLAALALTIVASTSNAGPFRRNAQPVYQPAYQPMYQPSYQSTYQPVYQSPTYLPSADTPAGGYVTSYTPADSSSGVYTAGYTPAAVAGNGAMTYDPASSMAGDGLDEVNALRAARGLRPYVRDEGLAQAARACAAYRAEYGLFGHTSNDFGFVPPGTSASSAGCAAYPAGYGWMSCCVYENYTYAGAAWVTGRDGRRFMHLFVR